MAAIYALADRYHKTPAEIRRDVTLEDLQHINALDAIVAESKATAANQPLPLPTHR